jgi:hypothetical protein
MIVAAATASVVAAMTGGNTRAAAMPNAAVATVSSEAIPLQKAQYVWGGQGYCWYAYQRADRPSPIAARRTRDAQ